jgi:alcohol dehydrogenase
MRAIVVDAFGAAPHVRNVPDPVCPADGVVIEVRATGLCRSDWHGWAGHDPDIVLPHVPGHEFAGVVAEVGPSVSRVQLGQRVTVPFVCACGVCEPCRAGAPQVCADQFQPGFTAWGSFAGLVAIPRADFNVVPLPDELDFVVAAGLGCRFATAYRAVTAHGRVGAGDHVAVFGCGGVGLSIVQGARIGGARQIIAVDQFDSKLEMAKGVGATHTVNSTQDDAVKAVRALTRGLGVDHAFEAVGIAKLCRQAIESLAVRGTATIVGVLPPDATIEFPWMAIRPECKVQTSRMGSNQFRTDIPNYLEFYRQGRLDLDSMISRRGRLDDINDAFRAMKAGEVARTVLMFD